MSFQQNLEKKEGLCDNNYLTQSKRTLFYKTSMYGKENNFWFVWFRNSKLFI